MKKKLRDAQLLLLSKFKTTLLANDMSETRFKLSIAIKTKKKQEEDDRIRRAMEEATIQAQTQAARAMALEAEAQRERGLALEAEAQREREAEEEAASNAARGLIARLLSRGAPGNSCDVP